MAINKPQKELPKVLQGPIDCLMIDNFDSFTWNLYQQVCELNVVPVVIRNDVITPDQFPLLNIKRLIISPGPGHPQTDSGVSRDAIKYFAGRVPILGVCMGLECIVDVYGGRIEYAGEIMHGKTSPIVHDSRGLMHSLPQHFQTTRYHSLSAHVTSLPSDLGVCAVTETSGVIMGVRHRYYSVEGVQYHPESIMSEAGGAMMKNFLKLQGGTWDENPQVGVSDPKIPPFPFDVSPAEAKARAEKGEGPVTVNGSAKSQIPSILQKIHAQRLIDVEDASTTPGTTYEDLENALNLGLAPPLISFVSRLQEGMRPGSGLAISPTTGVNRFQVMRTKIDVEPPSTPTKTRRDEDNLPTPALLAEIKRASPSKGLINGSISAPAQALKYAMGGASAISVLTEPKWFKGSLEDMRAAREAVARLPNRPAILRKDFIISPYQILEARLYGADTILLIVSMLTIPLLKSLYAKARELGMEPLVEVNNKEEMEVAIEMGAKVIGVNNRNLGTFEVDMGTTGRLSKMTEGKDVILLALSGIEKRADVETFLRQGATGILVGESLMRSKNPTTFIGELLATPVPPSSPTKATVARASTPIQVVSVSRKPLVKICGVRSVEDALMAAKCGADLIGMIFVPSSKRCVTLETARKISMSLRQLGSVSNEVEPVHPSLNSLESPMPWFRRHAENLGRGISGGSRPMVVGVFQDAPLSEIQHFSRVCMLDMVQLHGNEPLEWASWIGGAGVGVIRVFHAPAADPEAAKDESPVQQQILSDDDMREFRRSSYHHHILIDSTRKDSVNGLSGGSGVVLDWDWAGAVVRSGEIPSLSLTPSTGSEVAQSPSFPLPIFLAGGLTPSNVAEAVEKVQPWVVDISSGVEYDEKQVESGEGDEQRSLKGMKDENKVRTFVRAAKGLDKGVKHSS